MKAQDEFVKTHGELLAGSYDCLDRIVLNGYFLPGQNGGGMRQWWERLRGDVRETLKRNSLLRMGWHFARRVRGWGKRVGVPVIDVPFGERKHEIAEAELSARLGREPRFRGVFCVLVARAPAKLWKVSHHANGQPHLEVMKPWPMVYHLHFHVMDPQWGHVCFKISVHPPFGLQVLVNGHDWVMRQARRRKLEYQARGNAFVGGDFAALERLAARLRDGVQLERQLRTLCERWVYGHCLIHTMSLEEQRRSGFQYHWSFYQFEYSRNLLFRNPATLESCYQGLLDRTRRTFDLEKLKTLLGWKRRPAALGRGELVPEKNLNRPGHDVTVWRVKCGQLGFKLYDKTQSLLRVEVTAHKVAALRCGRGLDKAGAILERLHSHTASFLNTLNAAHLRTLDDGAFDRLPNPSVRGARRIAGVDLNKERMRKVCAAVGALAVDPRGFRLAELAVRITAQEREHSTGESATYTKKQAGYDLKKLRAKELVERIEHSHRYRVRGPGLRVISGALCLRRCVLRPVLAGLAQPGAPPPPEAGTTPLDQWQLLVQAALHGLLGELGMAA